MGGLAAARRLAEIGAGLPVVFISGYAEDASDLEEALQKPFDAAELGARVRALIDRRAAAAPREAGAAPHPGASPPRGGSG
jgi:DNA-binding response OmpR family regulator